MRPTNECRCNLQLSKFRLILCYHPIKSIYGYVDGFGNNDDKICFNLINCKNIKLQLLMSCTSEDKFYKYAKVHMSY